jgi:endonuclease/exonuclease/phosphatase family metal-dependent hydrolase
MKLASFNLENIFDRPKALNLATWTEGKPILEQVQKLSVILNKPVYSAADKKKIKEALKTLGVDKKDDGGKFVILRQNRGHLVKRPAGKPIEIVATGRGAWVGWIELKTEEVNEIATRNTAQVVRDVNPDVLGVIEVDNRIALKRFNEQLIPQVGGVGYEHVMLIDGNDDRGIDVGLVTRSGFDIMSMCSHVDDRHNGQRLFSRDCPEYEIKLPSGQRLLLLINHFKSKGFGTASVSNAKRKAQAAKVRAIYDQRLADNPRIAVIGDLNDSPDTGPLDPLLKSGSTLKDIFTHPSFQDDTGRPGTFGNATKSQKLDYILLSPHLFAAVTAAGVLRKGVWGGKNGTLWPHYDEMKEAVHAASDHAALWVELAI